jgi:S1-C subfamily serine protease
MRTSVLASILVLAASCGRHERLACHGSDVRRANMTDGIAIQRRTVADVAERAMPSVVSVWAAGISADPDVPEGIHKVKLSRGSGIVYTSDGMIVTNHHVIANAQLVRVGTADHHIYEATVVGVDPDSDIAVLHVEATELRPMRFADSGQVRIGDFVLAIGNPFGVGETVTMGIVSGLRDGSLGLSAGDDAIIQTDAAINPGESGGALVDIDGRLVGINTAILSPTGGNEGIAFAIPSKVVKRAATQLIERAASK